MQVVEPLVVPPYEERCGVMVSLLGFQVREIHVQFVVPLLLCISSNVTKASWMKMEMMDPRLTSLIELIGQLI
jgi:hypothetical protein